MFDSYFNLSSLKLYNLIIEKVYNTSSHHFENHKINIGGPLIFLQFLTLNLNFSIFFFKNKKYVFDFLLRSLLLFESFQSHFVAIS
ncbi:hypothetical protein BpHYR1_026140 [Brachionus plicatilis]|uniref:Uncharacterized protein n=1 Tax=Brachionus plicatilis TaxID=10195 RepID=A0A3M7T773_BRAPC|nr:hypothetical protein BpHYR1_026140 [Brachionus plicatilis]